MATSSFNFGGRGGVRFVPKPFGPSSEGSKLPTARPPSSASSGSGSSVEVVDRGTSPTRPPTPEAPGRVVEGVGRVGVAEAGEEVTAVTGAEVAGEVAGIGAAEIIPVAGALVGIGLAAAAVVGGIINNDNNKREAFTQQFVQQASKQFPNCNVVICHPQHKVAGPHVAHQHHELGMTVGTCGYDSYCSPMGQPFTFDNQGDGGYLNWAYVGNFNRNGNTLTAKL